MTDNKPLPDDRAAAKPQVISEEVIYRGRIVDLKKIELRMPDGPVVQREIVQHAGSVGILPVTDAGEFLLVRQFRPPAGRSLLEAPAGSLEPGEDPDACACRELTEEIGYAPGKLEKIAGFYLAPGWATEFMHAYIATALRPEIAEGDEDEDIEVVTVSPVDALALIARGEIADCKTVALIGLYLVRQHAGS